MTVSSCCVLVSRIYARVASRAAIALPSHAASRGKHGKCAGRAAASRALVASMVALIPATLLSLDTVALAVTGPGAPGVPP